MGNQRTAYGEELARLGGVHPNIVVCEADLGKSTMSYMFEQKYPERYFEMGIAEANMTAFAAGLSLTGKIAFTNSFAVFSGGRAYDQIRQSVAIGGLNVKINGSSAGLSDFGDGATHQSVEDIAIMRAIPNMTVLVPADAAEVKRFLGWMVGYDGPVYLRISRNDCPDITPADAPVLEPYVLRDGSDVCVFTCGIMGSRALDAAKTLEQEGVSVRVVSVPCLKPLEETLVRRAAEGVNAIVTAEEHSIIGGLSSVVALAMRGDGRPMECVAIGDRFGQSAENVEELMREYGLTAAHIADAIRKARRNEQ